MSEPTRETLVSELRTSGTWAEAALRQLADDQLAEGRYENGWNGRQILAHVAAIEWTYPRLLELAQRAGAAEKDAEGWAVVNARGGIDDYNRRQVRKREGVPTAELIEEFVRNRGALIEAVLAAGEELFEIPIRSAGGRTGTLAEVMREVAIEHVRAHVHDILGGEPEGAGGR